MNEVMSLLKAEMKSFEAVPASVWANEHYYHNETPVTPEEVCEVERVVNKCLQEQVDIALIYLKSAKDFPELLTNAYFETGNPTGKAQKDNVGHLMGEVTNTGHGLVKNLIGWLHKSHAPGKGQPNACSTRALGFGDYDHTYYKGAYNVAYGMAGQLRIANGEMASLLGQDYAKSHCLDNIVNQCAKAESIDVLSDTQRIMETFEKAMDFFKTVDFEDIIKGLYHMAFTVQDIMAKLVELVVMYLH